MKTVAIRGSGIAARGCAHILTGAGLRVAIEDVRRPSVPTIMLSDPALSLVRGVFDRPDLFIDHPRVRRRMVAWGGAPVMVRHGAVLTSEDQVQAALSAVADAPVMPADFTIHTASPLPLGDMRIFGERHAVAAKVKLRADACEEEARIEAVADGWLYLVPAEPEMGWLLGVGGSIDRLLGQSALIAPVVDAAAAAAPFLAAPRLHMPLHGADWLTCGTAALGFDPICGDGTAQSVREAILAAAVVTAIAEGGDRAALLSHYQSMLIAAMRRHLLLCAQFYANGGQGDWWRAQHDALVKGHHWCTALLAKMPEPQFLLDGFRLVPRQAAA
ncbi:hypothetical protein SAMN05518849_101934 [Sphingobium sp. AP50]|uniref:hypothetical protein n=1 Tax=Sphingobium sp. AP50 TaxID=1884369 RepID=UPI0008D28610|nr:hypothetical protein [Sphingobium sp. AP50]SEI79222.1 hypothetical protein SAMN05518849_101934 [Sphingobium sp. AP50]